MTQLRADSCFLSLIAGKKPAWLNSKVEWPKKPVFTAESAELYAMVLQAKVARMFLRRLAGKHIFMLHDDQVRSFTVVDSDFWDLIDPLWEPSTIRDLWQQVLPSDSAVDVSGALQQLPGAPWNLLRWAEAEDALLQAGALWLPDYDTFKPAVHDHDTPFYLRAQITRTIATLVDCHLKVWQKAQHDSALSGNLIARHSRKPYPWKQIAEWQRLMLRWSSSEALSYEDGDFLNDIMQSHQLRSNWHSLQQLYRDYGLKAMEDV